MYTINPQMPRVRRDAVRMISKGYSTRTVARHFGFSQRSVANWTKKAVEIGDHPIPTKSSRPKNSPKRLSKEIRDTVSNKRKELGRSIEVVHHALKEGGLDISLSSVYRILRDRYLLKRKSPWKKLHYTTLRPEALKPGDLVQLDTIHLMVNGKQRIYVYTLIDLYSRIGYAWATARAYKRMNAATSIQFVALAQKQLSFHFNMLQSDHGPEFGKWFVSQVKKNHRYTRIGKPNDNAHIERFNRTLQEECLDKVSNDVRAINRALKKYLQYYNYKRVHGGIKYQIPMQVV